jgi:Xaa-Pro aminopeptidase
MPLWKAGLEYKHGTGHGVGSQLCVHEMPPLISPQCPEPTNPGGLVEGMCVTNEPGFYVAGQYGIRIESLLLCVPGDHPGFLKFETLTQVPFCRELIVERMLAQDEADWVDEYHRGCWEALRRDLAQDGKAVDWLRQATQPLRG